MKIISTTNVHRDEQKELDDYLEENSWSKDDLTKDEVVGLSQIISWVIGSRKGDEISDLSYLDLINLKNKLNKQS